MAKVLKMGRKQAGWSKEFKCTGWGNSGGGCGALLLVSEYDLYDCSLGETEYHPTFCCPQCGVETDLKYYEDVPASLVLKGKRPSAKRKKAIGMKNLGKK